MQAIGRSRGGLTTKVIALTDRAGRFVKFKLKPGNAAEVSELPTLLDDAADAETSELLADKAYDSNAVRLLLASLGIIPTIPPRSNRREPVYYDVWSYKARHLVENAFADVKQFRGIATRYCKLEATFAGMLDLVCWFVGTKRTRRGESQYQRQIEPSGTNGRQLPLPMDKCSVAG